VNEIYKQLFSGVDSADGLRHAIARAVRTLREAMEKEDSRAVTAAHVRNLWDIDPEGLAAAFAEAERVCVYWPTPGQIRELAGWSVESHSRERLQWVFAYLEMHGIDGRPRGGGVRFGEDETGRRVLLGADVLVPAPEIPEDIHDTLAALGCGAVSQGLRYVSQHPVVRGWDAFSSDAGVRTADRIEGQWIRCFLQTGRKASRRIS
jgi:hypothetical protein